MELRKYDEDTFCSDCYNEDRLKVLLHIKNLQEMSNTVVTTDGNLRAYIDRFIRMGFVQRNGLSGVYDPVRYSLTASGEQELIRLQRLLG